MVLFVFKVIVDMVEAETVVFVVIVIFVVLLLCVVVSRLLFDTA